MSTTFNLTNTAAEVNTAIQAVVGADTTPTNGSANMVTSDGVFDYVATEVGNLSGKTVTTESTGIINTDNDGSLPTSAAVVDYVANYGKPAMGSLTSVSAGTYTAATDLYITLTSVIYKAGHAGSAVKNLAKITIEGNVFTVYVSPTTSNNTSEYGSASFFVKKGESYTIDLGSSSGILATAFSRTFNFTP
jgi:anaerobic selenocysteine-containing dehydrogenase